MTKINIYVFINELKNIIYSKKIYYTRKELLKIINKIINNKKNSNNNKSNNINISLPIIYKKNFKSIKKQLAFDGPQL